MIKSTSAEEVCFLRWSFLSMMLVCVSVYRRSKDRSKFHRHDTAPEDIARAVAERHSEETTDSSLGIGLHHIRSSDMEGLSSVGRKRLVIALPEADCVIRYHTVNSDIQQI